MQDHKLGLKWKAVLIQRLLVSLQPADGGADEFTTNVRNAPPSQAYQVFRGHESCGDIVCADKVSFQLRQQAVHKYIRRIG